MYVRIRFVFCAPTCGLPFSQAPPVVGVSIRSRFGQSRGAQREGQGCLCRPTKGRLCAKREGFFRGSPLL